MYAQEIKMIIVREENAINYSFCSRLSIFNLMMDTTPNDYPAQEKYE
jgi:hypothetical protein